MNNVIWLFVLFFLFFFMNMPVAFAMLSSSAIYMAVNHYSMSYLVQRLVAGPASFTLLAMGFFVLAGNVMNNGGVTKKLFGFAKYLVGWWPGGLGHVNVLASVFFAGMSGTATSDVAGLGQIEVKSMRDAGFDMDFSLAITGASSVIGPIIPPSIPAVMLAVITGVSTGKLFIAGVVPGVIIAAALMLYIFYVAKKRNYPKESLPSVRVLWHSFCESFFALLTPVIILAAIYTGVVTPTEAAALASIYAIILSLATRDLSFKGLLRVLEDSAALTMSVFFIVGAATVFSMILTIENVPQTVAALILSCVSSKNMAIFLVIVVLLIVGCFMDNNASILILTPVLYPILMEFGVNPIHACVIIIVTLMVGVITPPFGIGLFVMQGMSGIDPIRLYKAVIPFIITLVICVFLIAYIPQLCLWLPSFMAG